MDEYANVCHVYVYAHALCQIVEEGVNEVYLHAYAEYFFLFLIN